MNTDLSESGLLTEGNRPRDAAGAPEYLQSAVIFAIMLVGASICLRLAAPFFTPVIAALVLAILLEPVHRRIRTLIRRPSIAAGITVAIAMVSILGPIAFLVAKAADDAAQRIVEIEDSFESGALAQMLRAHPKIQDAATWLSDRIDFQALTAEGALRLTNFSGSLLGMSALQAIGALFTFYILFYFLRDRRHALLVVRGFLPFNGDEAVLFQRRLTDTVRATFFSTIVTGIIQGILGGAIFAIAGTPGPLLLGLLTAIVAILPVLGTIMVWLPAVTVMALNGDWLRAAAVAAAFLAIGLMDTFLYPALVGSRLRLHAGLTFVAVIGGLLLFGPIGFVFGPMVIGLTLTTKDILRERMKRASAIFGSRNVQTPLSRSAG